MSNIKQFYPDRLKEAREEIGMSKAELATTVEVSRSAMTQFEKGDAKPSDVTLGKLSVVLKKDIDFFFIMPERNYSIISPLSFRKLSVNVARSRRIAEIKAFHTNDILEILYGVIKPQPLNMPAALTPDTPLNLDESEIEALALKVRKFWNIGNGPIKNLSYLLENQGIICVNLKLPSWVDAFCYWVRFGVTNNLRPVIIVDSDRNYFRHRFDLAHELGHIVLHSELDDVEMQKDHQLYENQAHRFASAFLMPAEEFGKSVFSTTLSSLPSLKMRWGVSIAAIVRRLFDLGFIDDKRYKIMNIEISRRGWKKIEPGDKDIKREEPYYVRSALNFVNEKSLADKEKFYWTTGLPFKEMVEYSGNNDFFLGGPDSSKVINFFSS